MSGVIPAHSADRHPAVPARSRRPGSEEEGAGTLKRPSFGELFRPQFRTTTIVTTVMMACAYAAAFGAIQQMPRIVPGLPEVRTLRAAGASSRSVSARAVVSGDSAASTGRIAARASRRPHRRAAAGCCRCFRCPVSILLPLVFCRPATSNLTLLKWGIFFVGHR